MSSPLPDVANPRRLCDLGKHFSGSLALSSLSRLAPLLASTEGEVLYELRFDRGDRGSARIDGWIETTMQVACQRCMEPMPLAVRSEISLAVVAGPEEAERLPDELDPLLLEKDESIPLSDLLEDELLLALPVAPVHPVEACGLRLADFCDEPEVGLVDADADEEKVNPFAQLAELKSEKPEH